MRKILIFIISAVMLLSLGGCQKSERYASPDEILICIDISSVKDTVYRADMEYFLNGELMGGQACSNANESPLAKSSIYFSLSENDFHEGSTREGFTFRITLFGGKEGINELFSTSDISGISNSCAAFTPRFGVKYMYTVTGSYESGFTLK